MARDALWKIVLAALKRREVAPARRRHIKAESDESSPTRVGVRTRTQLEVNWRSTFIEVNTIGHIEIRVAGEELAAVLMAKPVLAFIWLYLLVRALLNPADRVSRSELAAELTPGLRPDRQRKRLRNRLSDMLHGELPVALAELIVVELDDSLRLDMSHSSIDLVRIQAVAARCSSKNGLLSPDLSEEVELMLDEVQGEFLPGWDQLEQDVNGGRGTSGHLVEELRRRTQRAQVDLCAALAASYMARLEPARAISLLERALVVQPEREDLARLLRAAYLATGQLTRASSVQRSYALEA